VSSDRRRDVYADAKVRAGSFEGTENTGTAPLPRRDYLAARTCVQVHKRFFVLPSRGIFGSVRIQLPLLPSEDACHDFPACECEDGRLRYQFDAAGLDSYRKSLPLKITCEG